MKNKVIIIDNDANGVAILKRYLQSHSLQLAIAEEAYTCRDGIELIKNVNPDLVFLNAEMPDGSGFDVIRSVQDHIFHTVIITESEKIVMPSFDTNALHFLRKPISKEKLDRTLLGFYQHHNLLGKNKNELWADKKMKIPRLHGYDIVAIKEIVRLQANGSYTKMYFSSGETILVSKHLKTYEEGLQPLGFVRIHKSHLVNTAYIKSIRKGKKGVIVLKDDTDLYFSNIYRDEILKHFID